MPIFLLLPLRITYHYATQTTSLPRKTSHHLQRAFLMWHDEKARKPQKHKAGRMKQILWDVMDVKEDIKNIKRKTIFLLRRKGNWMKIKAIGGVESPWRHNEVVCSMANWFPSHFNLSRKPFNKPLPGYILRFHFSVRATGIHIRSDMLHSFASNNMAISGKCHRTKKKERESCGGVLMGSILRQDTEGMLETQEIRSTVKTFSWNGLKHPFFCFSFVPWSTLILESNHHTSQ